MNQYSQWLTQAALVAAVASITACGGSSTTINEREPIVDDTDDHGHDHSSAARLLISEFEDNHVHVFDLADEAIVAEFSLESPATALYATPSQRYGIVVRGGDNGGVNFIDSGFELESHGDHFDLREQDPALLEYALAGDRPAHVTQADDQIAFFFDGNAGAPAQVFVLDEHDVEDQHEPAVLEYTTNQHGAAQVRGDYLLATVRQPAAESTLPDRVALFQRQDEVFTEEMEFDVACPGLHGSAQNHDLIAFGCEDGVLVIEQDDSDTQTPFSARKIAFEQRISSLNGDHNLEDFVGIGGATGARKLYRVQTSSDTVTELAWSDDASLQPLRLAFAEQGHHLVILDDQGGLTAIHTEKSWSIEQQRLQIRSAEAPEVSGLEIALSHDGHIAYATDRAAQELIVVDLEEWTVSERIALEFPPHKVTWLGVFSDDYEAH